MTLAYGQIRQWRSEPLDAAATALRADSDTLVGLADEFNAMGGPKNWIGAAADSATKKRGEITDNMERFVAGIRSAVTTLTQGADAVTGLLRGIREADDLATRNGFAIGDDGAVNDVNPPRNVPEDRVDEVSRERERIRLELVDRVEQNLRTATDIDQDVSGQLGKVQAGKVDDGGATDLAGAAEAGGAQGGIDPPAPPSGRGSPGDNAGWWDSLSDAEKQRVVKEHPEWIGNRDGVDFTSRDQANRALLPIEKERLDGERDRLEREIEHGEIGKQGELDQVNEKLDAIRSIEETLAKPGERQLVLFGTSSERAEAAIANGNLDTADNVAVFTPGLTSNVPDSLGGYDAQMADLQARTQEEIVRNGKPGSVATVTWIGYQAPQLGETVFDPNSVVSRHAADRGADNLAPFLQGIDAARDSDPHLTALGHSYGSTTTGLALQQNTGVDEAVFFGSPGLGTPDLDRVLVPDGHSTYLEAQGNPSETDFVGDLGAFGVDPSHLDGMRHASTSDVTLPDGRQLIESNGHSEYLKSNTTSQYNMSVIVGGLPYDLTIDGDSRDFGDYLTWTPFK
jgi:hypothetical protein